MKFSLKVTAAPYSNQGSQTALHTAQALLSLGHKIEKVFFYGDGVSTANNLLSPMKDQLDVRAEWLKLANDHEFELIACIAAALNRGVIGELEMQQQAKKQYNLDPGFELAGLGSLIEAGITSDRMLTFK